MAQVTANPDLLVIGSAKVEVGTTSLDLVNIGGCDGVGFEIQGENQAIEFDNADSIEKTFRQNVLAKFTWGELVLENLKKFFGHSGDTFNTVAAAPVVVTDSYEGGDLTLGTPVMLSVPANGAGTVIAVTSITQDAGEVGEVVLAEDDDYYVSFIDGKTYVTFVAGSDTDLAKTQDILFTHTPAAAYEWELSTGSYIPDYYYVRLTHTTAAGQTFIVDIPKAQPGNLLTLDFPADGGAEVVKLPSEFKGVNDATGVCMKVTSQIGV